VRFERVAPALASSLLAVCLARSLAGGPAASPPSTGFTLTRGEVRDGETLQLVLPGEVHESASREAPVLVSRLVGTHVVAHGELSAEGVRWVELADGGFVEAARLDRLPEPIADDLLVGEEGMISGRVVPDDYVPSDLVGVPDSLKAAGYEERSLRLRAGAADAFARLMAAAAADGITVRIFSAYRSAAFQRRLYAAAVEEDPAQKYSAAPGRSEHRLGTTVDVSTPALPLLSSELEDSPAGRWLARRAAEFGVVQTFSYARHVALGVAHEPWHLRWVGERTDRPEGW
jgi:hypothetical protein